MTLTNVVPLIEIDTKYGGVYAGTSFDFSEKTAEHFNAIAQRAKGILPNEFVELTPGLKTSIATPTIPVARPDFIKAWNQFRAVIDDNIEVRLRDYPRLYSGGTKDIDTLRGVPTYIPKDRFPDGFFGKLHSFELYQGDTRIFGPVDRFFHTETSGAVFNQIEDAPGKLVLEVRGDLAVLARKGEIVFFTDPLFGVPTGVTQVNDDGSATKLEWEMLGHDRLGDEIMFHEWVALGVKPRGPVLVVEVELPNRGTGFAAALYSGHTRDTAYRPDATVL